MRKNIAIGFLSVVCIFLFTQQVYDRDTLLKTVASQQQTIVIQARNLTKQAQTIGTLQNPRHFATYEEMSTWVIDWTAYKLPIIIGSPNSPLQFAVRAPELHSDYWGCDDIAEAMQRDALWDGYIVSTALVDRDGCVYGVRVSTLANHAGVLATVDSTYWFIEPQTGSITKIVERK